MKNQKSNKTIQKEVQQWELSFRYQLLDRLWTDCAYFLGYGGRHSKYLWAGNVMDQITYMREIWNSFSEEEKPMWLSAEQIDSYEAQMQAEDKTVSHSPVGECEQ